MAYTPTFEVDTPSREEIDALPGLLLLEFGVDWCPHCLGAQPLIEAAMQACPGLRHLKIEDGPGRRLGRSFYVKLWPTLVFIKDGQEQERLVRPVAESSITEALRRLPS